MTLICNTCGAENARDALSCWKCDATGEALRAKKAMPAAVWIVAAVAAIGALGGGLWWAVLRDGAPYAGMLNFATAPSPAPTPAPAPVPSPAPEIATASAGVPAEAEAALIADPVDGPFFVLFKQLLPEDYAAIMKPLLTEVPDPVRESGRFDELLSVKLEDFQRTNAAAIGRAPTPVLADMAANMHRSLRTPDVCLAAIENTLLPRGNLDARRIAAASNVSLIRAVAAGRPISATRLPPPADDIAAFNQELRGRMPAALWPPYEAGTTGSLPAADQCAILSAFWSVIAGYPAEKAAQWTAWQLGAFTPAQ